MIRALNDLVIRGPQSDFMSLLQRLETALTNGWRRDRALEERLRATRSGEYSAVCFSCAESPEHPAAALWLQARAPEEWYVSNIVPLGRNALSDAEYNQILGEFESTLLEPLTQGSAVHSEILPARTRLEHYLSPEARRLLRAFSSAANRTHLQPEDRSRWQAFVLQAHREDARLDSCTLGEWLREEGWPEEQRGKLTRDYEDTRALLARYDEEPRR